MEPHFLRVKPDHTAIKGSLALLPGQVKAGAALHPCLNKFIDPKKMVKKRYY